MSNMRRCLSFYKLQRYLAADSESNHKFEFCVPKINSCGWKHLLFGANLKMHLARFRKKRVPMKCSFDSLSPFQFQAFLYKLHVAGRLKHSQFLRDVVVEMLSNRNCACPLSALFVCVLFLCPYSMSTCAFNVQYTSWHCTLHSFRWLTVSWWISVLLVSLRGCSMTLRIVRFLLFFDFQLYLWYHYHIKWFVNCYLWFHEPHLL